MRSGFARVVCLGVAGLTWLAACSDDDGAASTVAGASPTTIATGDSTSDDPAPTSSDPAPTTSDTVPTTSDTVPTTDDVGIQRLYSGVLAPGTYAGNLFEHPITLTVGEGWRSEESFGTISLLEDLPEDSTDAFGGGLAIIDVVSEMSADEVLTRLVDREGITFSEPEPTSITGLDGVVVTADPPVQDVIYRFIQDSQGAWYTPAGLRSEVHVVQAPSGTRLIWIEAPPERWEAFRPTAQSVIESIIWGE
ncbi:MAG TPA: hypothetical protein VK853_03525 [Ilumatobacteraceae bacterium]|nr:hypothetical protein [Ilumatobacteraceae bacterium]